MEKGQKTFYRNYYLRYLEADQKTRQAARDHWTKAHAENILSDRNDMIIFSGQILAMIMLAEKTLENQKTA